MLYLKFIDDLKNIDDYTDKFLRSYLMFVRSRIFVKLSRMTYEN